MLFEKEGYRVIQPLDPILGNRFVEPMEEVWDEGALDQLYNLTTGHQEDYINPMADGELS